MVLIILTRSIQINLNKALNTHTQTHVLIPQQHRQLPFIPKFLAHVALKWTITLALTGLFASLTFLCLSFSFQSCFAVLASLCVCVCVYLSVCLSLSLSLSLLLLLLLYLFRFIFKNRNFTMSKTLQSKASFRQTV